MNDFVSRETTAGRGVNLCVASFRRCFTAAALCALVNSAAAATLEIAMRHVVAGEPLQLGSFRYATSVRENFSVTRLSYLLSDFAFQRGDGSWVELTNSVAWFDAEKQRVTATLDVPDASYQSIRFNVGMNTNLNHADVAKFAPDHPLNPNLNGLHWSWQGGYVFLALEGLWRNNGIIDGWSFHFARDINRSVVTLATDLPLTNSARLELDFDLASLLSAPRALSFAEHGTSTHSRAGDPIIAALKSNLPSSFRVRAITSGDKSRPASVANTPLYMPKAFTPYRFTMSATFPEPNLPKDNPLIEERVTLGEKLFNEPLLSRDGKLSCASCHDSKAAFADTRQFSVGVSNRIGTRNAMPLFNLAWKSSFFWDGRAPSLRAQVLMPIQDHAEMDESLTNVVAKLKSRRQRKESHPVAGQKSQGLLTPSPTSDYGALFSDAFGSIEITPEKMGLALEAFLLTLTSFDSKFDRAMRGDAELSADEKRGFELFMTEYDPRRSQFGADCFHCHGGPLFQSQTFANNGLDSIFTDRGRARITRQSSDEGKFATPSLRNVALTPPYMHDGRFATLEEVVEHYSSGLMRSATLDPNLAKHPEGGPHLTREDKRALVAFLRTLTDESFRHMPDRIVAANP